MRVWLLISLPQVPCNRGIHTLHWVAVMDTGAGYWSGCKREASTMTPAQSVHRAGTRQGLQPLVNMRMSIKTIHLYRVAALSPHAWINVLDSLQWLSQRECIFIDVAMAIYSWYWNWFAGVRVWSHDDWNDWKKSWTSCSTLPFLSWRYVIY